MKEKNEKNTFEKTFKTAEKIYKLIKLVVSIPIVIFALYFVMQCFSKVF